jgi:predicted aldo/keto reductase-like oxidoreductase
LKRNSPGCVKNVEQSLRNLQTDHVDLLLMHAVSTKDDLDMILAKEGAFHEALKLKEQGKILLTLLTGLFLNLYRLW